MTNWAVVVGINQYEHLSPQEHLKFAVSDAERVKQFLCKTAGFQEDFVILCSDTSKPVSDLNTRPTRSNLRTILRRLSQNPQAKGADQAWFFFSGHGLLSKNNQNYILTCDGVPDDLEETALSVDFVIQQLIHCQAKNTVLVLDMCRNEAPSDSKGSSGFNEAQIVQQAQQNGIIKIFSCSRGGKSYEIPDLQQGAFTHAFLAGLQQHTILRQLSKYLVEKVYDLTKERQPVQIPLIVPEPDWKMDLPLLPQCVTNTDITQLREQANDALYDRNYDLALQLWEQIATNASETTDRIRAIKAIKHILELKQGNSSQSFPQPNSVRAGLADSPPAPPQPPPKPAPTNPQNLGKGRVAGEKYGLDLGAIARKAQPKVEDDLSSEKGIDYTKLRDLLKAQQWKEADQETYAVMIRAVGKKSGDWFTPDELLNFPCTDLKTIDGLWVKYSNGHFGFSVQKRIWEECGSPTTSGKEWDRFCVKVGWQNSDATAYVEYSKLRFDPKKSPKGELPSVGKGGGLVVVGWFSSLAQRLVKCSR